MGEVIDKLVERTAQGRVPWKIAVGESRFSARLGNSSVLISSFGSGRVKLSVINERGTEIDSAEYLGFPDEDNRSLAALFSSAKRAALGADQTLTELLELLDDAPPVVPEKPAQD